MPSKKNENKINELAHLAEKKEAHKIRLAQQLLDKENKLQSRKEQKSKSDLVATQMNTQMQTMFANFLAQMKQQFNPPPTQTPSTITPIKSQDPVTPKQQKKDPAHQVLH